MAENICPVCGNKEGFRIVASGSEYASLISYGIGSVDIIACSKCGCVYVSVWDREIYKKNQEKRKRNG